MDSSNNEDLACLFLPDILNNVQSSQQNVGSNKVENIEPAKTDFDYQTSNHQTSYQDFLNNNNFINRSTENMLSSYQLNQQMNQSFSHLNHFSPYMYDLQHQQAPQAIQPQAQQQLYAPYQQTPEPLPNYDIFESNDSGNSSPRKKKSKSRKKDLKHIEYQIDYKPNKLKNLLDFKPSGITSINDYKIIDKSNEEVNIEFNGFLNGRFLTNDIDNNNYIFTKNELTKTNEEVPPPQDPNHKEDPKVISCYRRNYIQISLNMNINNIKDESKLLKLQTSEYGYTTTRVIKYFKIEISAVTNMSKNVPIIIKNEQKESKKNQSNLGFDFDDQIHPNYVNSNEHVVNLNESIIENNQIDQYFVVKKLQFKNATPNNGNLTFQNYYHLKIKLSCIVADIYYDDYVNDIENVEANTVNEIILSELISTPIIVRGRNPSFYAERKDLLIKGRSSSSKKSFKKGEVEQVNISFHEESHSESDASPISTNLDYDVQHEKYKYYPISNVYYLPPVNVVYFPHGAHHPKDDSQLGPKSNVYFK